ncbi:uncharacterized protein LOC118195772, partial [Stegodyphus dumicola]|uniref:uncharacterized protein LOC118195772 n=1 Tax=Stegodyphus dumicola TaxID=202533 RepID=UPI0015AED225
MIEDKALEIFNKTVSFKDGRYIIVLAEKDRDAVRFLFVKNIDTPLQNTDQLEVYRFKRVLFGVNSSPFLLAATIKLHIQKYRNVYPYTFQILDTCMYVDDLVTGADDVSEALKTSREAKEIMRGAGMNLRKWKEKYQTLHPPNSWKIYDPLGLITPFTVRIKLLLQKLWLRKLSWDEELPSDLNDEWSQWCSELSELSYISVPRFALDSCDENIEIHVFSDASQKLYGAAVYVKVQNQEKISVNLLASKSRVSPVKKVSLPRLELLRALIGARLGTEVKKVLDRKGLSNIFFWSDSKVKLFICNCRKDESRKVGPLQLEE